MINAFRNFMETIVPNYKSERYLLGVSGGMDSMAMLYLFKQSGFKYAVANVNFSLRGAESDTESKFVKDYCEMNNIKLYQATFETSDFARTEKISTQMAARDLRYNWFNQIKEKENFSKIAIAHHLDDQVETFFINLIRGTGIAGMHGISSNKHSIIRPLLFTDREKLSDFIKENNIPYKEDSSNASDKYQRNYIRHHILPEFKKLRTDFSDSLNQSVNQLQQVENYALFHINAEINSITTYKNGNLQIDTNQLISSHSPELILYYCLKDYNFQLPHIKDIIKLIEDKKVGSTIQSSSHEVLVDRHFLFLKSKENKKKTINIVINSFSDSNWKELNIDTNDNFEGNYKVNDNNLAFIDANKLEFPLVVRNWNDGDFFYPLGMKNKKKISDFFIDNKISRDKKDDILILCNAGEIAWIIGYRIDNRYAITKQTTRIIKLKYNGNN